jgi:hypothetical protein
MWARVSEDWERGLRHGFMGCSEGQGPSVAGALLLFLPADAAADSILKETQPKKQLANGSD